MHGLQLATSSKGEKCKKYLRPSVRPSVCLSVCIDNSTSACLSVTLVDCDQIMQPKMEMGTWQLHGWSVLAWLPASCMTKPTRIVIHANDPVGYSILRNDQLAMKKLSGVLYFGQLRWQ